MLHAKSNYRQEQIVEEDKVKISATSRISQMKHI